MSKVITIEVINVSGPTPVGNSKGGTYNTLEIAYKQDGKVQGKKLIDFTAPEVFAAAAQLKAKDIANVTITKEPGRDGKEYWNWKAVSVGELPPVSANTTSQSVGAVSGAVPGKPPAGRVTGSNYETPDERAARQLLIVRQSSVTAALKYFEQTEADVSRNDVVELAEFYKDYVYNGVTKVAEKPKTIKSGKVKAVEATDEVDDDSIPF